MGQLGRGEQRDLEEPGDARDPQSPAQGHETAAVEEQAAAMLQQATLPPRSPRLLASASALGAGVPLAELLAVTGPGQLFLAQAAAG